jgi:integrase/recombinase XerD
VIYRTYLKEFTLYLKLERGLSGNTIDAYLNDVSKLFQFLDFQHAVDSIAEISYADLKDFISWLNEVGMSANTQARIISGIKAYFNYLAIDDLIEQDPTELLEAPKTGRKLPDRGFVWLRFTGKRVG